MIPDAGKTGVVMVKSRWYFLLALGVALMSGLYVYRYLQAINATQPVALAAQDVPAFTAITGDMVKAVSLPVAGVHPEAVRDKSDVVGRYSLHPIRSGEQILEAKITGHGETADFLAGLRPDQRAVMIPVSLRQAVGGSLTPGHRIDVMMVVRGGETGSLARTLLPGIRVLELHNDQGGAWHPGDDFPLAGVVVAVSSLEAEKLAFALEHGELYLSLLPFTHESLVDGGVGWHNLFAEGDRPDLVVPALVGGELSGVVVDE